MGYRFHRPAAARSRRRGLNPGGEPSCEREKIRPNSYPSLCLLAAGALPRAGRRYEALKASAKGNKNVAIGAGALSALTAGGDNIALGANAGSKTPKGARNIYIGSPGVAANRK
jgi:hypothetical protein